MKVSELLQWCDSAPTSFDGVHYFPIRPITKENKFMLNRIKAAWRVLTGKSDAIEWDFEDKFGVKHGNK